MIKLRLIKIPRIECGQLRGLPLTTTHALKNNTQQQRQCPACHQGQIIRGRRAWGCSVWRTGCAFVVPFEENGVQRVDSDLERLVKQHNVATTRT